MTNNTDPRQWTPAQWLEWTREKGASKKVIKWLKSLPSNSKPWEKAKIEWRMGVIQRLPLDQLPKMMSDPDPIVRFIVAHRIGDPEPRGTRRCRRETKKGENK